MRHKAFTREQVAAIRASEKSSRDLAKEYGVSYVTILAAKHGKGAYKDTNLVLQSSSGEDDMENSTVNIP